MTGSRYSYLEFDLPDLIGTLVPGIEDVGVDGVEKWADNAVRDVLGTSRAPVEARRSLWENLVEWAEQVGAGDERAVFLCFDLTEQADVGAWTGSTWTGSAWAGKAPTSDAGLVPGNVVGAYVSAVLEWDLVARWDDVPTVEEVARYASRLRPGMWSPPDVGVIDLPGGRAVSARVVRVRPEPGDDPTGNPDDVVSASWTTDDFGRSFVEESLTVAVVNPDAGVATVTGTWLALHDGPRLADLVTTAAGTVRIGVHETDTADDEE